MLVRAFVGLLFSIVCFGSAHAEEIHTVSSTASPSCAEVSICQSDCKHGSWYGGIELTLLKPYFEDGRTPGSGIVGLITNPGVPGARSEFDLLAAPRFYVGFEGANGFGFRSALWYFGHSGDTLTQDLGGGDSYSVASSLEFSTMDLEAMQTVDRGQWGFLFSGGFRYGHTEVNASDIFNISPIIGSLDTSKKFDGFGPTVALEVKRQLGQSNVNLFAKGRASVLFGNTKNSLIIPQIPVANISDSSQDFIPVFDTQIGLEWNRRLSNGWNLVLGTAMEAQVWGGAGGYDNVLGSPTTLDPLLVTSGGLASSEGNVGFFGATFNVGFTR
jgi:hypothetical protein